MAVRKSKMIKVGEEDEISGKRMREKREIIMLDPTLLMDRILHYRERHSGWNVFRYVYWSIYLTTIAIMLLGYDEIGFTWNTFLGSSIIILVVMLIVYGLTTALHNKLLKKYG